MKKTTTTLLMIFLFSSYLNSQEKYTTLWQEVTAFEQKNLPKSALKTVDLIYKKASTTDNTPQIIKALFHKSKYVLTLEEDAELTIINQFKEQIAKSSFPAKNILENVLANLYWQYFNQNRYQFYNRTKTENKVDSSISAGKIDFRTWDLDTLFKEINCYFKASLENETKLQNIAINAFAPILQISEEAEIYSPTLYDFLANNALTFYKTSETAITQPANKFTINNENYLSEYSSFSKININTEDETSLQLNALKIYQKLIQFHLKTSNKNALALIDIERLHFVNNNATFKNNATILNNVLKTAYQSLIKHKASGLYAFEIANILNKQAESFSENKDEKIRFKNQDALLLCATITTNFPKSLGAQKCANLKATIKQATLTITAEAFLPIHKKSRLLIDYKNIETVFFTAYKISQKELNTFNRTYKFTDRIQLLNSLEKVTQWKNSLRNENDYLKHTTETIVPEFNSGSYLILASKDKKLEENSIYGTANIQVTDLVLIENNFDATYNYQVVNRNNGAPVQGAEITLNGTPNNKFLTQKLSTDKNGFATFAAKKHYSNILVSVKTATDFANFGNFYFYKQHAAITETRGSVQPFIFTDRSIYRPGQTVYFKTIVIKNQQDKYTALANKNIVATLKDVNQQTVKQIDLKLNEFGSASGEFILPNSGLTGAFSILISNKEQNTENIYINNASTYFSVEEYKRPKFKTQFKPIVESYKINDRITVNGFANAFSGAKITDAKVVYRVHRKVQYPNWYFWRSPFFTSESQEIIYGETTTDATGNYKIDFTAMPDESVSKKDLPIFVYEVTADVTDINGETHSTTTLVKVGYHALLATILTENKIDKESKNPLLEIDTKNLNNEFIAATGTLKIYKLQAPENPLRKRPWQTPSYQDISEKEFRTLFPNDAYSDNEITINNWKKGALVFTTNFNTKDSKEIYLKELKKWTSGAYRLLLESKDKFGQLVKDEKTIMLYSSKKAAVVDQNLFTINTNKPFYNVNDTAEITIASASKNITVILQIEKNNTIIATHLVQLNNSTKTIKIPVTKNDIGGFAIKYQYVNFNYFDSGTIAIKVPEERPTIEIETNIFRDKLQPGAEETWSFTIKNDKNDQVAAEVLAAMYDASLDQFKDHNWVFNPIKTKKYNSYKQSNANRSFSNTSFNIQNNAGYYSNVPGISATNYKWFGFAFGNNYRFKSMSRVSRMAPMAESEDSKEMEVSENTLNELVVSDTSTEKLTEEKKVAFASNGIQIRKNFNETAFFFPDLKTDKNGQIRFSFTMPEALTKWKLQLLAHTKTAETATKKLETVTQKELMIVPNAPRFLREGDEIIVSAKITNLTNNQLAGFAKLILTDAITGKEIDVDLENLDANKNFTVAKDGNTNVSWNLSIPETVQAVQYKIIAKAGAFSDGEQNVLPVLSNRMLVTETLPMWVRSNETKTFTLDKLKNNTSSTLKNHKLTLEITSNPAWYAIQALPYLMEYPYECAEQTFAKYYANTLASFVANSNPRIQEVFTAWKSSDALLSNLEKNEELKSLIIQETPWLRDAQSETEQKKRIALLFDLNKMKNEQEKAIIKLQDIQMNSGGFPWFKGSKYESIYITQYIVSGFGHLKKLGVTDFDASTKKMIEKAVRFLDGELLEQYQKLLERAEEIKQKAKTKKEGEEKYNAYLAKNNIGYFTIQYLYMRSFYTNIALNNNTKKAVDYYQNQTAVYWNDYNLYAKGQIALSLFRVDEKVTANKILKSLKENSITSNELGMYWKENTAGYYYYQAPIETQALMIEVFSEVGVISNEPESEKINLKTIDNLKIWLLKNKQTNRWKTTKATTEAVYALLLNGTDWISVTEMVDIQVGDKKIDPSTLENVKVEAGTGYFKTSWNGSEITPKMSEVTITKKDNGIAWGGLYWQYFEDLDKITSAETPLKLDKKLFLKVNSDTGKELQEITNKTQLKVGDLITVRIELRSDRNMEFIHMKDMRAAAFEPINVLSSYKWQDNLGYYESTKDAATNFFFDRLPKGIYVFEYDVRVNNSGNFSNGITTIESMYAPEFRSHSMGERVEIKQ